MTGCACPLGEHLANVVILHQYSFTKVSSKEQTRLPAISLYEISTTTLS